MGEIMIIATFPTLTDENRGEFTKRADEAIALAQNEPGTMRYDWHFPEDKSRWVVVEQYIDSDAVLAHLANQGAGIAGLAKLAGGLNLQVFGDLSPQLAQALQAAAPPVYSRFAGK
ncbi:putative quinol monooxygenase [Mycolicibacterium brumae]|uniref:Antibiotic biosynthesis monooxygenase n=1 Tax=Mycolicibacterium brumae TaxID=85968 RepID=A0A2G5PD08_9MYCO|nr:antibiotic biosynthesis monooxygenase family protein [Mycolicibacterium brumae]MCV7193101.1 antibiotic biosynthesis monooxygenase [Mycolicibacterium brumae]PIB75970.1 antibiotic biosynthesis monooxygenase [Mycolicibacterium brumae]RWA16538.1 hypothetical protein MBRU_07380 [Mycolicibacterium brumae DSM 44177]UWW09757.1 antibiotic biosynthesis monooxygenase [Mycolicibacterium brumae]